jgi:hypothetical protein
VDLRTAADFAGGHAPGSINIPLNRSFTAWAGWLLPYDKDFYLIVDESTTAAVDAAVRDLALIGLDRIGGYFAAKLWRPGRKPRAACHGPPVGVEVLAGPRDGTRRARRAGRLGMGRRPCSGSDPHSARPAARPAG